MKRIDVIKKAQKRLYDAQKAADKEQKDAEVAFAVAEKMMANGLYIAEDDGLYIIATLRNTQTIH